MKVFIDFDENELSAVTAANLKKILKANEIEIGLKSDIMIFIKSKSGLNKYKIYIQENENNKNSAYLAHLIERRFWYREEKRGTTDFNECTGIIIETEYENAEKSKMAALCYADAILEYFGKELKFGDNITNEEAVYILYIKGFINDPEYWLGACADVFGISKMIKQTAKKFINLE